MSAVVRVNAASGSYDIVIGRGLLEALGTHVRAVSGAARVALVTDDAVSALYGAQAESSLSRAGFEVLSIAVPAGEPSKNWTLAGQILERLAREGIERTDIVVALGGGVVGDLAGFCAGVYMRGIAFVQVPTTLLAQVDSSVGGKTAVDLESGKNLAGVFVQPELVVADTATLDSLPEAEWRSGLAEVAKSAVLDGEPFLGWLESHSSALLARDATAVAETVRACVAFKSRVVEADEREEGLRESLNLGHTLGHAIEKVAGYGAVSHGYAVAEGMRFAAALAGTAAGADHRFVERQSRLLDALGLRALARGYDLDALRLALQSDKKARAGSPRFVLATGPGTFVVTPVSEEVLTEELCAWQRAGREET